MIAARPVPAPPAPIVEEAPPVAIPNEEEPLLERKEENKLNDPEPAVRQPEEREQTFWENINENKGFYFIIGVSTLALIMIIFIVMLLAK